MTVQVEVLTKDRRGRRGVRPPVAPAVPLRAPLDQPALARIVESEASTLLIARSDGVITGTLTLVMFEIPTGMRAWIEDVVVDEAARGQGIGEALTVRRSGSPRRPGPGRST